MRTLLVLISLISFTSCNDSHIISEKINNSNWSELSKENYLLNRQDTTKWDMGLFKEDLEYMDEMTTGPFTSGVFPVPKYDLIGIGSFNGVGAFGYNGQKNYSKKIKDKVLLYNSFFVNKDLINKDYLDSLENEIFFQIIVLTNFIDTVNFSHLSSEITSRNHPDYLGQGFYKTLNSKVDYATFITADRQSFAIINNRLFDLNFGKTILIAPQKDRSFRSLQIKSPEMSTKEIEEYTENLLKEQKVIDFFTYHGNI